jgi:protease-4
MCSAAYYIGSATSHIIANKRADAIGSIGVMVSLLIFLEFMKKGNYTNHRICHTIY